MLPNIVTKSDNSRIPKECMLQALEREPEEAPSRTLVTSTEVSESPYDRVSHSQV